MDDDEEESSRRIEMKILMNSSRTVKPFSEMSCAI